MIEIKNLSKSYHDKPVLHDINLNIANGGITSVVGANGAGKSTLLSVISRLEKASHGQVYVDGMDIAYTDSAKLSQRLSILRQDNHLVSRLSVRDLVAFGRYPYSKGRLTENDQAKVNEALQFLDLTALQHRFLDQLSGGQRQRAFVAMVMCQDTDYLLLDEPLNNLDMQHSVAMMKLIRRLADELQRTIVLVIHDINFAAAYSDHIIALKDGHLVCHDTPQAVMQNEMLEYIFDTPIRVEQFNGKPLAVYYR